MKFTRAIVRKPAKSYPNGITTSDLGKPNYELALEQHHNYCEALIDCGLELDILEPIEKYPDSCFVEDTAVIGGNFAVIALSGDYRRKGESAEMLPVVQNYRSIFPILHPGSLDGGDIMQIEDTFYIGVSNRTNIIGAEQFSNIVQRNGYKAIVMDTGAMLHLKTGVNYLGDNTVILQEEVQNHPNFESFERLIVKPSEAYAANSLRINDYVLVPAGFNFTCEQIQQKGFDVLEVDVSEFQKMDGGLSCLSLRF